MADDTGGTVCLADAWLVNVTGHGELTCDFCTKTIVGTWMGNFAALRNRVADHARCCESAEGAHLRSQLGHSNA